MVSEDISDIKGDIPRTMAQKILAAKAGTESVVTGQFIIAGVDLVMVNDITCPPAVAAFEATGVGRVFDPQKVVVVPDHFTPNKDIASAEQSKRVRDFAAAQKTQYYEVGRGGIAHVILPEMGLISPGMLIMGADSHTCTYGALGAMGLGIGSTDAGAAMATGKTWLKVPETIRVELSGDFVGQASAKDLILHLIGLIGTDGARYKVLEFGGPGLANLTMEARLTVANMTTEAGAKAGLFEIDEQTEAFLKDAGAEPGQAVKPDPGAEYVRRIEIDLSELVPVVSKPHSPANVSPAAEMSETIIDQVVIGSCTNGRLSDLAIAANILKGKTVAENIRLIVIPGSQKVWLEAMEAGYLKDLAEAGAAVSTPSCGPCLGGHLGILAEGEACVSTTNRNFRGRMGHAESMVYLASPATAAASAITGKITSPEGF